MNFPILALFSSIVEAVRVGDYRGAACSVGKLITAVTCQTQAQLAATARPQMGDGPASPMTESELYEACEKFCEELEAETGRTKAICAAGAASDATLSPTDWVSLAKFALELLRKFINRPKTFVPSRPVVAAFAAEGTVAAALPPMSKPSGAPAPSETGKPSDEKDDEKDDEEDDKEDDEPPAPPAPKKKTK